MVAITAAQGEINWTHVQICFMHWKGSSIHFENSIIHVFNLYVCLLWLVVSMLPFFVFYVADNGNIIKMLSPFLWPILVVYFRDVFAVVWFRGAVEFRAVRLSSAVMCEYFNFCFGPPVVIRTVLEPITQLNASVLCYLIVAINTSMITTPSGCPLYGRPDPQMPKYWYIAFCRLWPLGSSLIWVMF